MVVTLMLSGPPTVPTVLLGMGKISLETGSDGRYPFGVGLPAYGLSR